MRAQLRSETPLPRRNGPSARDQTSAAAPTSRPRLEFARGKLVRMEGLGSLGAVDPVENRRIEVLMEEGPDGRREVVLQDMSFGAGVGWYVQKSLRLDAEHVDVLLKALCCVRSICARAPGAASSGPEPAYRNAPCANGQCQAAESGAAILPITRLPLMKPRG